MQWFPYPASFQPAAAQVHIAPLAATRVLQHALSVGLPLDVVLTQPWLLQSEPKQNSGDPKGKPESESALLNDAQEVGITSGRIGDSHSLVKQYLTRSTAALIDSHTSCRRGLLRLEAASVVWLDWLPAESRVYDPSALAA